MRTTAVLRGIRSVFPLIKEHAPGCVTELPNLAALPKATRLAFDATLMVQRLHFADDRHPHRHVLGFHRLASQMRELGLVPIMVFDNVGQGARLQAKAREQERRARARTLVKLRASAEVLRARRLEALGDVLARWNALDEHDRRAIAQQLEHWEKTESRHTLAAQALNEVEVGSEDFGSALVAFGDLGLDNVNFEPHTLDPEPFSDGEFDLDENLTELSSEIWQEILAEQGSSSSASGQLPRLNPSRTESSDTQPHASEKERLAADISALMRQFAKYQKSIATSNASLEQTVGMSWAVETSTQSRLTMAEGNVYARLCAGEEAGLESNVAADAEEAKTDAQQAVEVSESQEASAITHEANVIASTGEQVSKATEDAEGKTAVQADARGDVMDHPRESKSSTTAPDADVAELSERSAAMLRSYDKTGTPLSSDVFEECAELCRLHKIPVLWTGDGSRELGRPHEGEAMASMLVRQGYADIVVSEDSDVLLYDVPLLRGVMGQKGLQLVDSAAVRRTFFPPLIQPGTAEGAASKEGNEVDSDDLVFETHAENQSRREMLEFALLCGTDFNRTMPGIAARRALKLIREFKSIDAVHAEALRRRKMVESEHRDAKKAKSTAKDARSQQASADEKALAVSSALVKNIALRMPDGLSWREYSKELTVARHVFTNPPTLHWQQRKIRHLKRPLPGKTAHQKAEPGSSHTEASWPLLPPLTRSESRALQAYLNKLIKSETDFINKSGSEASNGPFMRGHRPSSGGDTSTQKQGFGNTPFGDGGPVASWSW